MARPSDDMDALQHAVVGGRCSAATSARRRRSAERSEIRLEQARCRCRPLAPLQPRTPTPGNVYYDAGAANRHRGAASSRAVGRQWQRGRLKASRDRRWPSMNRAELAATPKAAALDEVKSLILRDTRPLPAWRCSGLHLCPSTLRSRSPKVRVAGRAWGSPAPPSRTSCWCTRGRSCKRSCARIHLSRRSPVCAAGR